MFPMMDSPGLRELSRTQLQSLAKRELVRAVGKTEDIIRRLMRKHPKGVPAPGVVLNPSASSGPQQRIVLKIPRKGTPSVPLVQQGAGGRSDPKGKSKAAPEALSPSPSSSIETLRLLYPDDEVEAGPSNTNPRGGTVSYSGVSESEVQPDCPVLSGDQSTSSQQSSCQSRDESGHPYHRAQNEASNPGWRADEDSDELYDKLDYPQGAPNHYMVVDALRKFTTLVNTIPSMEARVAESRCLLQRAESSLEKAIPDARELAVTREYLEAFLLAKMKQKPELWDGTAKMKKAERKLRMEWLRAERRKENEKRWKETNKLYEESGLQPEPFSAFASQSDEEVIESLQTTPTSGSGSSKRSREESVDGYSDTDDKSQRKRARP